jgi:peroxiredoxin/outer membrane lipoprotein-sorting protein
MRILLITAALLLANVPARAARALTPTDVTAESIFSTIVEKAKTRSTEFEFEQSTQMMGMTITGAGKGVYHLPRSRTDLTFNTPIGEIEVRTISDGKTLWQIEKTPVSNKAIRYNVAEPLDGVQSPVDPFMAFAGVNTQEFLDAVQERFDAEVQGVDNSSQPPTYLLVMKSRDGGAAPTLHFKIGVDDAFPREMRILSPDGEPITEMKVTRLAFDQPVDNSLFDYTPPAEVQVVDASDLMPRRAERPSGSSDLEGKPAPEFTLTDLKGREVALSSLKGKHVLIDFWATWCPPCKKALPHVQKLSEGTNGLVVLTVNAEPASVAQPFLEKYKYTFTTLVDTDRSVSASYGVTAIPTTFIIDPNGTVAKRMIGYHTAEQIKAALASAGLKI